MEVTFFCGNVLKPVDSALVLYSFCHCACSVQCIVCLCEGSFCGDLFQCADDKCIDEGLECDDVNNCFDNSDEEHCC